jgi:hypothetical protein
MTRIVTAVTHRAVQVRKLRKRTVEVVHLRLAVPVGIREIAASEMRTAAMARNPDWTWEKFFVHDGRYLTPATDDGGPVQDEAVDSYFAGEVRSEWQPAFTQFSPAGHEAPRPAALLPEIAGDDVREIVSDDTEQRTAEVRRHAEGFALVDGKLWRPSPEPSWTISRAAKGRHLPVLRATADPDPDAIATFRLDRFAEADRFVRAVAKALKRRYEAAEPTVTLDGAPLDRDDRLESAKFLGQRVYDLCPKGWLRLMPRDAILQWYDLREDVAAAEAGAAGAADAIASRVGRILEAMDSLALNPNGEEDRVAAKRSLFAVLSRWTDYEGGSLAVPAFEDIDEDALAALATP